MEHSVFTLSPERLCQVKVLQLKEKREASLTEVAVVGLFVDEAHGNVPARRSAHARVARLLPLQGLPGYAHSLLDHSDSVVRGCWSCRGAEGGSDYR